MDAKALLGNIETIEDRQSALEQVKKDGTFLKQLSPELKKDKEFVTAAVSQNPIAILFADDTLAKDEDIMKIVKDAVKDAIIKNPISILLADASFMSEEDIMGIVNEAMEQTNLLKNKNNLEQIEMENTINVSITDGEETIDEPVNFILVEAHNIEEIKKPESYVMSKKEIDFVEAKKLTSVEIPSGDLDTNFQRGLLYHDDETYFEDEEDFTIKEETIKEDEDDFIEEFDAEDKYLKSLKKEDLNKYIVSNDKEDNLDVYINIDEEIAKKHQELTQKEISRVKAITNTEEQLKEIKAETIEEAVKLVSENGLNLQLLPNWNNNLIVVATAVVQNKKAVKYADKNLQICDDILLLLEDIPQNERIEYLDYLIDKQNNKENFEIINKEREEREEREERKKILSDIFKEEDEMQKGPLLFDNISSFLEKARQYTKEKKEEIKRKL